MNVSQLQIDWNPELSIYASEAFLQTISDEYGWLGGTDDAGQLRCLLPYSIIDKSVFRLVRFPVETIFPGGEVGLDEEAQFLGQASAFLRSKGADVIIPATFNTVFRTYPAGAIFSPFGSYILDLCQAEPTLWANLHSKHRNVIRSATNKGVKIHCGPEHLECAYALVRDSFTRSAQGVAGRLRVRLRMDKGAFCRQIEALGVNAKVFVAEFEGTIQGCAVIPHSNYSAYYMHGGTIANPVTGAMNLLQWEAMRLLQKLGVRRYDFYGARIDPEPGSKIEGIMKFKERFGGKLTRGYMWKLPLNPRKYALYSLAARLRNGGDVVDQERRKFDAKIECPN